MLILAAVILMAVDPSAATAADSIPWPAQLGLNLGTVGALISFFIWQNRQITLGRWYPEPIVKKMLEEKDSTIADKEKQITGLGTLIEEQRQTIRAQESTADTLAKALVQATSNQNWIDILVQRAIGGVAQSPLQGDNTPKEVPL